MPEIGSRWCRNDSGREFIVVDVAANYVTVENTDGPARRRRILACALKPGREYLMRHG